MPLFLKQRKNAVGVSSNKLVQSHPVSLFEKPLLTLHPEKNTCFPWSAGSTLSTKLFSARLWTSTTQWPARKSPQPWFFGGKSQGLEGVPTVELWVTLAFAPSWLNWEPPLGGVERVWPRKFWTLRVEEVDVLMGTGNWGGSQLNQGSTSIGSRPPLVVSNYRRYVIHNLLHTLFAGQRLQWLHPWNLRWEPQFAILRRKSLFQTLFFGILFLQFLGRIPENWKNGDPWKIPGC